MQRKAKLRQQQKITPRLACLLLKYLAFLRPAAERAGSVLPWIVSQRISHGFLWADSIPQKHLRKDALSFSANSSSHRPFQKSRGDEGG
jgi:hypothetical protein